MKTILLFLCLSIAGVAQTSAPPVSEIAAVNSNGQTFVTWTDAAAGLAGAAFSYNLYRATGASCPITNTSRATLVAAEILNNSGQLTGPTLYNSSKINWNQTSRQQTNTSNGFYPMATLPKAETPLALWSGLAVYTNLAPANACYAVVTCDAAAVGYNCGGPAYNPSAISVGVNSMTGTIAESVGALTPVLQIPGTDPSRYCGIYPNTCAPTSAANGQPLWLKLHGSGGAQSLWGDVWALWLPGWQDGIESSFTAEMDHNGNQLFNGGVPNQMIIAPQESIWSIGCSATSGNACYLQTYWWGYMDAPLIATDTHAYAYPFTQTELSEILSFSITHYVSDPNRVYGWGESMGGYGSVNWSLRQPNTFAGIFLRIPVLGPWNQLPQINYGASSGVVSVTNGSPTVSYVSGNPFAYYMAGRNMTLAGAVYTIQSVAPGTASTLTLTKNYIGSTGSAPYQLAAASLTTEATTTL
jgi:hypothetical protein